MVLWCCLVVVREQRVPNLGTLLKFYYDFQVPWKCLLYMLTKQLGEIKVPSYWCNTLWLSSNCIKIVSTRLLAIKVHHLFSFFLDLGKTDFECSSRNEIGQQLFFETISLSWFFHKVFTKIKRFSSLVTKPLMKYLLENILKILQELVCSSSKKGNSH